MQGQKWQYKTVNLKASRFSAADKKAEQMQDTLNRLGLEGWRLVSTTYDTAHIWGFLKKPL